jgi:nucleoid DNA-binding protein
MNKADLIEKISGDAGVTKTQANAALDSFVEAVTKSLKGGGKVTLVGFGTFSVSKEKPVKDVTHKQEQKSLSKREKLPASKQVRTSHQNSNDLPPH